MSCRTYGPEVRPALEKCFDLLGGIGSLVKNKTVTVKLNLTGNSAKPLLGRPIGETYTTHYATAMALGSLLFAAGARRVRLVESTQSRTGWKPRWRRRAGTCRRWPPWARSSSRTRATWARARNTRTCACPGGGYMFSAFDLNHAYEDTDVLVSLAKLKNHVTAGVTLSMKNLFGLPPNSLYGIDAGKETATGSALPAP